jgi:hypothetical protein
MEFDGVPIANDGTVPFRARERIFFTAFTTLKPTGSTARVKVWVSLRELLTAKVHQAVSESRSQLQQ